MAQSSSRPSLTAQDIVDLKIPQQVHVAPNGKRVAYVVQSPGQAKDCNVSTLWIAKVGEPRSARQVTSGLHHDWSPLWAPDHSKRMAFLSDRAGKGSTCAIYLMHREHFSEPMLLTPNHTEKPISRMVWSPDGQHIAFSSPDPAVGKDKDPGNDAHVHGIDWEHHQLHLLDMESRAVSTLYSGPSHVTDFTWREDSEQIFCTLNRDPGFDAPVESGVEFVSLDRRSGRSVSIGTFQGPTKGRLQYADESLFFVGGHVPSIFGSAAALYELHIESGRFERAVGGIDSDLSGNVGLEHSGVLHVQQSLFDELWARKHNTAFKLMYSVPQEISCYHAVEVPSDDSVVIALVQSNAQAPPEVFTLVMAGPLTKPEHAPLQLSTHNQALLGKRLMRSHEVSCKSFDKQASLLGVIFVPDGYARAQGPLPTVCMIHGGPYARVNDAFAPRALGHAWLPFLVSSGRYAVLCPNYRGSAAQGDAFARGAHGKLGTVDYDDTLAVVAEGVRRGVVDRRRLAVAGWSQGGFLAYLSAVRNGYTEEAGALDWRYSAAVAGAGVTEWDLLNLTARSARFGAQLVGAAPWERSRHDVRAREASAVWELRSTEARVPPTLILHPEADVQVPVSQALAYYRVARAKGVDVQLVTYPREGHLVRERAHQIDMLKRVLRFFDLHTGQSQR